MLIKNVLPHSDDLHDGRPIAAYGTAEVSAEDLSLAHYQSRIADGLMIVVPEDEQPDDLSVAEIKQAIDAASEAEVETVKAGFRAAEEARERPRRGVLDITHPASRDADTEETAQ